ncbi:MAG: 4-hydroxyacetophenone monooxygenase [Cryobacterium sp.]|jgi:cation diffusion facilitator CzcD-associated flavoprotein CzcO|nr:4-hydroxyacetophenone monooxygenase [Cryobacterium sp.]
MTDSSNSSCGDGRPDDDVITDVETLIVGAGFAGLGMGIRLARRGETSFVILERSADVGGTWRDNIYPGVACDIPSHLYSFSFLPNPSWSHYYARGPEIQSYLRDCARAEGLLPHLRFGADVREMRWDEAAGAWLVSTSRGRYRCHVLVMAAGRLSEPQIPQIPGLSSFPGHLFHSSQWDEDADLRGARIGVIGTGASAVQLVPRLAQLASSLVIFQRTAPYVVPRNDYEYSQGERNLFKRDPITMNRLRSRLFWNAETGFAERIGTPGYIDRLRTRALGHLAQQVLDPGLRAKLTPGYEIGCKRVLLSDEYYPALIADSVTLEPSALKRVDGNCAVAASGAEHHLDALIVATGFQSTQPPFARRLFGRGGLQLAERWRRGMVAYASTTVNGFPNMFIIDGPNASLGHNSAVYMIEAQIDYILAAIDYRSSSGEAVLEVTLEAEEAYVTELDRQSSSTVWINGGCGSWYVDERSKRLTLLWPDFAYAFRDRLRMFDVGAYERRAKAMQPFA